MKKIILFSPTGYIGCFLKEMLQSEEGIQLFSMTRDSTWTEYRGIFDIMIYSASVSNATAEKYVKDNVETALSVIRFCREHQINRIIYLSSDSIYGELHTDTVTEKVIMVNPNMYGTTKYLAEKIIMESGIPYYILRLPGVVGRVWRNNFICNLMEKIKNNEQLELYNIHSYFNNVLDIDDLLDFIKILCHYKKNSKNEIFLLGNTEKLKLIEVVQYVKELYHSTSQIDNIETEQKKCFTLDVTNSVEYGYSSKKIKEIIEELYNILERGSNWI